MQTQRAYGGLDLDMTSQAWVMQEIATQDTSVALFLDARRSNGMKTKAVANEDGGDVRIEGTVKGYVRAAGGRVLINGPVDGDVVATAGAVELGPNARIAGQLRYASREEVTRDAAAQVQGGVQRMQAEGGWPVPDQAERSVGRRGGWVWSIGLMAIAAVLVGAFPGFYARLARTLRTRGWTSLLLGFIALVCIPVAALILMFTLIGMPLALLAIMLYLALLLVGYVSTGIGLGAWALAKLKADRTEARLNSARKRAAAGVSSPAPARPSSAPAAGSPSAP